MKRLGRWCLLGWAVAGAGWAADEDKQADASPVSVSISGADEALADNLRAFLPSMRHIGCDSPADQLDRFVESSEDKLYEAAEAMGYFDARFETRPVRAGSCWALNIAVTPGRPVRVASMQIELSGAGKELADFREAVSEKPYAEGDVLVTQKYEDFKTRLSRVAARLGFFDADFTEREIAVNIEQQRADIRLHFETGPRYQLGEVRVEQDVLDERHLKRYIRLIQGQTYDADLLLKQRRILEGSGYYAEVLLNTDFEAAEALKIPVSIKAVRNKRYTYSSTIGFATDTGLKVEGKMQTHWVNAKGHKLDVDASWSEKTPSAGFVYTVPLWMPESEFASAKVNWKRDKNDSGYLDTFEAELEYTRVTENDWKQSLFLNYQHFNYEVYLFGGGSSQLNFLGARVSKTHADDSVFPERGWSLKAEVKGASDSVFSDVTALQGRVDGKYLYSLESGGKFITRGSLGTTWVKDYDSPPIPIGFLAGGQSSVRGYDFESIGADGYFDYGRMNLIVGSVEYEHPVTEKISAAAFVDAGSAFDAFSSGQIGVEPYDLKVGVGFGVRYKSPVGPIRVDFAVPTDDYQDLHFYFSLGPDL
ncbi:MAG: outer membrane protein assembly factor [Thiothrix sp.]|nr:outer membrane protein assembly factor [Thiothrix sp.]